MAGGAAHKRTAAAAGVSLLYSSRKTAIGSTREARRAGNEAGHNCDHCQYGPDGGESYGISRVDPIKRCFEKPPDHEGCTEAYRKTDAGESEAVADDEAVTLV